MGRAPCCDRKQGLKKGPWTPEEDKLLVDYIQANGHGSWRLLPKLAVGFFFRRLLSCLARRLAIGRFAWSMIAAQLPGRTDNEIKNYWNTHLKKQLRRMGLDEPPPGPAAGSPAARHMAQWETARLEAEARLSLLAAASSSSGAATATTTSASSSSDIGDSFRKAVAKERNFKKNDTTAIVKHERQAAMPGDDSSAASNEMEVAMALEEYQMFLDMAGEEMGTTMFHGRYGDFSLLPQLDVLTEASPLAVAFK
ncbi:hypothetical protein PR202_ga02133 [Eleusine coracana subsp. coracana]|uniref:Uncharacterized protein n=1 Tax=Eleusine coracana subsp. coracana TaxID=191504 RepID=A0AAV5BI58_ELECO|nr:hypothetical protein PR202_ga01446 [Eleusine coracana subsp. coracana]GJM86288.1 hypothetical protein PR202_ga02133 [Eleusine coracana subsp. coracana]